MDRKLIFRTIAVTLLLLFAAACRSVPPELAAEREALNASATPYSRPFEARNLPEVHADSPYMDLLDRALRADPVLEAALFEWWAAVENIVIEGSPPDPSLGIGWMITEPLGGFFPNIMAAAAQMIPAESKLNARARKALAAARTAHSKFDAARFVKRGRFREAYATFDGAARDVEILEQEISAIAPLEKQILAGIRAGSAAPAQLLQFQLEVARLEDSLAAARSALRAAMAAVNVMMSRAPFEPLDPPPPTPTLEFDATDEELLALADARNPGALAAEGELLELAGGIAVARGERDSDLELSYLRQGTDNQLMLGFTVPLRRDRIDAMIAQAEARYREALARRRQVRNDVALETSASIVVFREAERRAAFIKDRIRPQAQDVYQQTLLSFSRGGVTVRDIIEARRALLEVTRAEQRARVDREKSVGDLLACCGADFAMRRRAGEEAAVARPQVEDLSAVARRRS